MKATLTAIALTAGACAAPTPPEPVVTTTAPTTSTTTTTAAPTTVPHTHAPRAARRRAASVAPVAAETAVVAGGDVWAALAACESGNRPGLRNPPYSGAFQFLRRTWQSLGYSGEAADHSYEVQREAAQRLQARSGWSQWPACSRKLGLR